MILHTDVSHGLFQGLFCVLVASAASAAPGVIGSHGFGAPRGHARSYVSFGGHGVSGGILGGHHIAMESAHGYEYAPESVVSPAR